MLCFSVCTGRKRYMNKTREGCMERLRSIQLSVRNSGKKRKKKKKEWSMVKIEMLGKMRNHLNQLFTDVAVKMNVLPFLFNE